MLINGYCVPFPTHFPRHNHEDSCTALGKFSYPSIAFVGVVVGIQLTDGASGIGIDADLSSSARGKSEYPCSMSLSSVMNGLSVRECREAEVLDDAEDVLAGNSNSV